MNELINQSKRMPKYPIDEPFLEGAWEKDETNDRVITRRKRYNCCNNKDVCIILSSVLCIVLLISGLTCLNIYAIQTEDGSFEG